jgi:hypothetical protein
MGFYTRELTGKPLFEESRSSSIVQAKRFYPRHSRFYHVWRRWVSCFLEPNCPFNANNPCSLDLTAASRAYLLEPHWNPMMEEQALCRVHRVGQQRDVTTIRYLMRGSFEEVSSHHRPGIIGHARKSEALQVLIPSKGCN